MLRRTVTAWFLLATLLGPKACCCSLVAAAVAPRAAPAAAAAGGGDCRCCHDERHAPTERQPRRHETPLPSDCPCKVAHDQAALRAPTSEIEVVSDSGSAADFTTPIAIHLPTASPPLAAVAASPPILKPCPP